MQFGYLAKSCGGGQLIGKEDSVVHNNHSYDYTANKITPMVIPIIFDHKADLEAL